MYSHESFLKQMPGVDQLASLLGQRGFRTTISIYVGHPANAMPWILTIGERGWQRHIAIETISDDGRDGRIHLLRADESEVRINDVDVTRSRTEMWIGELLALDNSEIKKVLKPITENV
jgi:hypothetical protein